MTCEHEGGSDPCVRNGSGSCVVRVKLYDKARHTTPEYKKQRRDRYATDRVFRDKKRASAAKTLATPHGGYANHLRGCKKRKLTNELTLDQYTWLRLQPCIYCGSPSSGVDRIKNEFGYTILNSAPCCKTCNFMKMKLHVKAYLIAINAATKHSPSYELFKQRWIKVREDLCQFSNINAPVAEQTA